MDKKKNVVVVKVNPKIFPLDIIYSAAYSILERAYVILDGDPEKEVYVILKPKILEKGLEELGYLFYNELLNAAFYTIQLVRNKELREALIRATTPIEEEEFESIAKTWEERFGRVEGADQEGE